MWSDVLYCTLLYFSVFKTYRGVFCTVKKKHCSNTLLISSYNSILLQGHAFAPLCCFIRTVNGQGNLVKLGELAEHFHCNISYYST